MFLAVKGLGIDVVDVGRIRAALDRRGMRFVRRLLTEPEIDDVAPGSAGAAARLAARFAAKEAVVKALGCGVARAGWKNIVVLRGDGGPLRVELRGRALAAARVAGVSEVLVTITHERAIAVAVALAQGE